MDISLRDLAAVCGSNNPLNEELIQKIDQITHTYGVAFDKGKGSLCSEVWHLVATSLEFWTNASVLLSSSQFTQTKLQVLLLIQSRVKSNWVNQDPTIKEGIKKYLCNQSQNYSNGDLNNLNKSLFRVINRIIVEILKYQWMSDWANFLYEICQAITSNPLLAENYFDLLHVIFEDIFVEEEKLTSEEIKKIREQIINNYNIIQKAFQQYLSPQTPKNVLKNCVLGLDSLIQWLPSYYIYFGLIIDKLIHLFEISTDMKVQVLNCLMTIFELPNDDMVEGIISKAYDKKRTAILALLQNRNLRSNPHIVGKMLSMSENFLKSQKSDVEKFGEKFVFPDNGSREANKNILGKIGDWMSAANQEEDNLLSIYKFISAVGDEEQGGIVNLIENIIDFAPCPLDIQYFACQKIINMNFSEDGQYEQERKNYKEIINNIVQRLTQDDYQSYIKHLIDEVAKQCTNLLSLKRLCRVVWNFYYFIQICPMPAKQVVIMQMINSLMNIQDAVRQSVLRLPNTKDLANRRDFSFRLIGVVKLCIVLLAGLACTVKKQSSINSLTAYVELGFLQSSDFIKGVICILRKNYYDFEIERKKQINISFLKAMANRKNRLEIDMQYIRLIGSWVLMSSSNMKLGLEILLTIFQPYQQRFVRANNKNLNRREDVESGKTELFESGLEILTFISQSTPYFKSEIIFETQQELKIIKQTVALCDLSGNDKISVLFYQKAAEVFTSNFQQLKKQQISKNINIIVSQNLEIVNFILQSVTNNKICEQIVGSMLKYLGKLLYRMADWQFEQQHKLNLTYRIISVVLGCNYSFDTPQYIEFIHNVIRCNRFPYMNNEIISVVINKIFILATFETEERTCKSIQMFKSLLNDSIGSSSYNELVTNYIIDLTTNIYVIILRKKSSFEYIKQYSQVLFLALVFIRNLKMKFSPDQAADNVTELAKQLSFATQKNYYHYPDSFMKKIDNFLTFILNLASKQDFSDKLKDLLIVLRRGY